MDYAIAIDRVSPGAKWRRAGSYAELVATWEDVQLIPPESELIAAFIEWESEQATEQAAEQATEATKATAEADFANLPGWASWTGDEAAAWIDTNVNDLASAKVALQAMAKAIMYLRDMVAPDIGGG